MNLHIKNDSGFLALAVRMVIGWTYFSAFFRRTILANKLDPELPGYIGEKFNHFLPNALGIKPIIQYLVENPDILYYNMVAFTIIEGIVGLFIMLRRMANWNPWYCYWFSLVFNRKWTCFIG